MKKTLIYMAAAVLAASCVYPFNPEIDSEPERNLVVDGSIVIGGTSTVSLSYVSDLGSSGASLLRPTGLAWIEDSQGNQFYSGTSVVSDKILINTEAMKPGLQYRAVIEVDGNRYCSDWVESDTAPDIREISFTCDDNYVYVWADVKVPESRSGYVGFSYEECWEFHADYYPEYDINPETYVISPLMFPWAYYWCYKYDQSKQNVLWDYSSLEIRDSYKFLVRSFSRTDSRNHKRYSILVKAFAMSKDAYLFIKNTQEMSELGGDLFTPEPGMLEGNVHCESDPLRRAFGYVMACEAASKREYLNGIYLQSVYLSDAIFVPVEPDEYAVYYNDRNYRPVKKIMSEEGNFIGWGPARCINCLEAGGTQKKPDFWED
jgi:hypothetical protein